MLQELAPLNEGERVYEMNHHFIDVFPLLFYAVSYSRFFASLQNWIWEQTGALPRRSTFL